MSSEEPQVFDSCVADSGYNDGLGSDHHVLLHTARSAEDELREEFRRMGASAVVFRDCHLCVRGDWCGELPTWTGFPPTPTSVARRYLWDVLWNTIDSAIYVPTRPTSTLEFCSGVRGIPDLKFSDKQFD